MYRAVVIVAACATVFVVASGCASVMQGSEQRIGITSTPSGASVTVDGVAAGTTPILVPMKRESDHLVVIMADGYVPYQTYVTRSVSGAVAGNIVAGGPIGAIVDKSTGAMYKLTPASIDAVLVNGDAPPSIASNITPTGRIRRLAASASVTYPARSDGTPTGWGRPPELFPGEKAYIVLTVSTTGLSAVSHVTASVVSHIPPGLAIGPSSVLPMLEPGRTQNVRIPVTAESAIEAGTVPLRVLPAGTGVEGDTLDVEIVLKAGPQPESVTR